MKKAASGCLYVGHPKTRLHCRSGGCRSPSRLGQHHIARRDRYQPWEVAQRQGLQLQVASQRRERQRDTHRHHHGVMANSGERPGSERTECDGCGSYAQSAFATAAFDKPAGLEQGLHLHGIGVEHPPHQAEGEDIENRADRSKEDHKAPEIGRVPALRLADLLIIDVIKRDRHTETSYSRF